MSILVKETESVPAAYPVISDGLTAAAQALEAGVIWSRIEAWCRFRWSARQVVWIVEGEGQWSPPLEPVSAVSTEVWESGAWVATTPPVSPLGGYLLPGEGPYRITATVGGGEVPDAVGEAYRRLAEYSVGDPGTPGATSDQTKVGPIELVVERAPAWLARALQNSGAADLLRPYRRLK